MDVTKKRVKFKLNKLPRLKNAAYFAFALILGICEAHSGVYPFAIAYLCAVDDYLFPIFLGTLTSTIIIGFGRFVGIPLVMAVFALKWIVARKNRKQPFVLKICLAFFSAGVITLCEMADRNALFHNSLGIAAVILVLPLCTLLFSAQNRRVTHELTLLAYAFITVKALGFATVGSLSAAAVAAAFVTLYAARSGYVLGGLCGFACGMAAGLEFLPVMGLLGICFGILYESGKTLSAAVSYILSVCVGTYLVGIENSIPGILNPLIGVLLFLMLSAKLPAARVYEQKKHRSKPIPLKKLGGAFSSLSGVFYTVSQSTATETKHILASRIISRVGALCQQCNGCDCDKFDLANHMSDLIAAKGIVFFDDLPIHVRGMCRRGGELLFAANSVRNDAELVGSQTIRALADEYLSFSKLLCSVGDKSEDDYYCDPQRNKKVASIFADKGISFRALSVTGRRKLTLAACGVDLQSFKCSPVELITQLSSTLGSTLSPPELVQSESGTELRMTTLPKVRVECAKAMFNKNGESVCGDTVSFFENDDGVFYSLIADGMGSGRDAALTSRLASIIMEKLLSIGADKNEVLNLLNKMLVLKNQEIFTTIDLLEIDKLTGDSALIKAGAAPTFLYRGDTCFRLEAQTPPAGIMNELQAAQTKLRVGKGDIIVMLSDGLLPSAEKPELPPLSSRRTAASLAAAILEKWSADCADDDRSVCVIRVF